MSQTKPDTELKVFITTSDSSCSECGEQPGRHAWITLVEGKGALCLACADLDHLAFLPSGDGRPGPGRAIRQVTPLAGAKSWTLGYSCDTFSTREMFEPSWSRWQASPGATANCALITH